MNKYLIKIARAQEDTHLKEPARPEHLGIDLSKGDEAELYKWFLAVNFFNKPIQRQVAANTFHAFNEAGLNNPDAIQKADWDKLIDTLHKGHYARYDFATAAKMLNQAQYLKEKYGTLTNLIDTRTVPQIRAEVESFNGVGPLGSQMFVEGLEPHLKAYTRQFQKEAAVAKEHQKRVVDKLEENDGVVANHSLGSGKTLTALLAIEKMQKKHPNKVQLVIAPASLTSNVDNEIKKHGLKINRKKLIVTTYDKAVNDADSLAKKDLGLVVLDEAHKIRNTGTKRFNGVSKILERAHKRLLLTATPSYNKPSDIAPLVNAAANGNVLPEDPKAFEERYIGKKQVDPGFIKKVLLGVKPGEEPYIKNKGELKNKLSTYIDNYDATKENPKDFPEKIEKIIKVPMSKEQHAYYKYLEGKVPFHIRIKIRSGLPLSKKESASLNAFASGVRQVSVSHAPFVGEGIRSQIKTPKITKAVDSLEDSYRSDKNFRGVVYSSYIEGGLVPYSNELKRRGIPHTVFTGALSKKEKDAAVEAYNTGKVPVLLLSDSGGEGINLKGTKKMQILNPHFNRSKIDQVVGRGIRFKSHEHLPANERKVEVEHYLSTLPDGLFGPSKGKGIDEYLHVMSLEKDKINQEMKKMSDE